MGKSIFTATNAEKAAMARQGAKVFERQGDAEAARQAEELARRFDEKDD